jgi:hypothetical protein
VPSGRSGNEGINTKGMATTPRKETNVGLSRVLGASAGAKMDEVVIAHPTRLRNLALNQSRGTVRCGNQCCKFCMDSALSRMYGGNDDGFGNSNGNSNDEGNSKGDGKINIDEDRDGRQMGGGGKRLLLVGSWQK